jgi:hypothetical protein
LIAQTVWSVSLGFDRYRCAFWDFACFEKDLRRFVKELIALAKSRWKAGIPHKKPQAFQTPVLQLFQ